MGEKKNREMLFWTKDEYLKFADVMMDNAIPYLKINPVHQYKNLISRDIILILESDRLNDQQPTD